MTQNDKRTVLRKLLKGERTDALKTQILVCHRNAEGQLMQGDRPVSQQFINKFAALLIEAQNQQQAQEIQRYVNKLATMDFIDNH